jgi:hypothetical protein
MLRVATGIPSMLGMLVVRTDSSGHTGGSVRSVYRGARTASNAAGPVNFTTWKIKGRRSAPGGSPGPVPGGVSGASAGSGRCSAGRPLASSRCGSGRPSGRRTAGSRRRRGGAGGTGHSGARKQDRGSACVASIGSRERVGAHGVRDGRVGRTVPHPNPAIGPVSAELEVAATGKCRAV